MAVGTVVPAANAAKLGPAANEKDEEKLRFIEEMTANPDAVQEKVLVEILARNAATEYLRRFGLGGATDRATFKAKVPVVTYEDLQPEIQRIDNGDRSAILSAHPISELLTSYVPGLDKGKGLYFLFVKSKTKTPGGLTARPVLTNYFKSRPFDPYNVYTSPTAADAFQSMYAQMLCGLLDHHSLLRLGAVFASGLLRAIRFLQLHWQELSTAAILCADAFQSMYAQMLCGLLDRHSLLRLGTVFASGLLRAIRLLQLHWQELSQDIAAGTLTAKVTDPSIRAAVAELLRPDPDLTRFVPAECGKGNWAGIITRIWPNTKYLDVIVTGAMAQYIPTREYYSGGLPMACTMYASSECYFGLNLRPMCDPSEVSHTTMPNMPYFEFLPCGGAEKPGSQALMDLFEFLTNHALDGERVHVCTTYLTDDMKLWWQVNSSTEAASWTWEVFRDELRRQFLLENSVNQARDEVDKFRHTEPIQDYARAYSTLMLQIPNKSEADWCHTFLRHLQPCAEAEVRWQVPQGWREAMAVAKSLVDARTTTSRELKSPSKRGSPARTRVPDRRRPYPQQGRGQPARLQSQQEPRQEPPRHRVFDCFLCKGPHRMRDCPNRERVTTIAAWELAEDNDSLILESMIIGAIMAVSWSGAKLIFVPIQIRGVEVEAMVDTGATHLFVSERMAAQLDLHTSPTEERVKTINTAEQQMVGIAYNVSVKLGPWSGRHHVRVARIDNFDVILGYELLQQAKVSVMPHLGGVQVFHEDKTYWISGIEQGSLAASISNSLKACGSEYQKEKAHDPSPSAHSSEQTDPKKASRRVFDFDLNKIPKPDFDLNEIPKPEGEEES